MAMAEILPSSLDMPIRQPRDTRCQLGKMGIESKSAMQLSKALGLFCQIAWREHPGTSRNTAER